MIDSYSFGKIVVDGTTFEKDLIIRPDRIEDNWWRREGHRLSLEDIRHVIVEDAPEVLVMGTGKYGILKVDRETRQFLKEQGVELIAVRTDKAVVRFNELHHNKKVVGAFHLTC